jgi:HlyD family secretion protein
MTALTLVQRRLALWGGLGALLVAGLAWSFRPQAVPVDIAEVARGRLTVTIDEEGETRVRDVFELSAPVAGRMRRIDMEVGDEVVAGETVVAQIEPVDPTLLDARTATEARAEVRAAEAEVAFAKRELDRQRQLSERGVVSARDLDAAEKADRTARAALENARAALLARELLTERANAPRAKAGARDRSDCVCIPVLAPVPGRVLRIARESAGVVQAGDLLVEIGDPSDLEIVVDLLSADAVRVEAGQEVLIEDWGGRETLHGRVHRVEPYGFTKVSALGIEEQRVNVIVRFTDPPEKWQRLGHGYRVETRIVLWRGEKVIKLPLSALFRAEDGAPSRSADEAADWAVFVQRRGRARLRPVTRGHHNGLEVEIRSGLEPGDRVVLHPSDRVRDGARITARR